MGRVGAGAIVLAALGAVTVAVGPTPGTADVAALGQHCTVVGAAVPGGSPIISGPMVPAVTGAPLDLDVAVGATATPSIAPGGLVTTLADLEVDLASVAHDILVDKVHPAVEASGYPELVAGSWVELDLPRATLRFPAPSGATAGEGPTAASPNAGAAAAWDGDDAVVTVGPLHADSRVTAAPTKVAAGWRRTDGGDPAPRTLPTPPPALRFSATVTVGVSLYGSPVTGSVTATWACAPADAASLADTAVATGTVTTTTPSPLPVPGDPPGPPPTTAPPTTWPSAPTLEPGACAAPTLDRFGGDAGVNLEATGRFRTERHGGRWWFVDPDGHPFWSAGVNHVTFAGTPDRNGLAEYRDNVTARYGSEAAWADAELERLPGWGYNTLGAWSDTDTFASRMPYTLLLGVTGSDFATGRMQDLWEPAWSDGVESTVAAAAAAHGDDPMLVGYWFDNELHWGPDWRPLHLFDEYLAMPAAAPGKVALLAWLQDRYPTFAAFAADITTSAHDWAELAAPTTASAWTRSGGEATRAGWVGQIAERYYAVTDAALERHDPDHLNLGARMIAQVTGTPVLDAAARHVDVISLNTYTIDAALVPGLAGADPTYLPVTGPLAAQAARTGKPLLVSEWGFRAADSGLPNTWPPLFPTLKTQQERAAASEAFELGLLANTSVVGQHIFEWADEPAAGRFDGEDSNFGLVDKHDDPYADLVEVSQVLHDCAYARLHQTTPPSSTTTTTTTTTTATAPVTSTTAPSAAAADAVEGTASYAG